MKTLRFLFVLSGISLMASVYSFAADPVPAKDKPKDQTACACPKDKDGKACGVDKACCCTGAAATKADQKKDDCQKADCQKADCKKDGCKACDCKKP